ncbi:MAG: hypothetical protein HUJ68_00975, partial [Clostridia bacterium]|nr:hypothetical protein [Clostridia bacterium]
KNRNKARIKLAKAYKKINDKKQYYLHQVSNTLIDENQIIFVDLLIQVKDSLHFLGLPYIKYSSGQGLSLKLKAKDSNFLGSMNELNTSLEFNLKPDNLGTPFKIFEPALNIQLDYPFNFEDFRVTWLNNSSISYKWGNTSPEWNAETGVLFEKPISFTVLTWKFTQSFIRNFEYSDYGDATYFSEYASFSIPFNICEIPNMDKLFFTPTISIVYNWDPFDVYGFSGMKYAKLQGPVTAIKSSFTLGRINWIGNFRDGFYAELYPAVSYNIASNFDPKVKPYSVSLCSNVKFFKAFKYIGINSRINIFAYLSNEKFGGDEIIDSMIRGIIDDRISPVSGVNQSRTSSAITLNLDFPIHLFTTDWENFLLTKKISFLKKLNFEVQLSPFIDLALIRTDTLIHNKDSKFKPEDGLYGAGLELLIFPLKWSSYVVRLSYGIDVGRVIFDKQIDKSWRNTSCRTSEFSIGLGTHF